MGVPTANKYRARTEPQPQSPSSIDRNLIGSYLFCSGTAASAASLTACGDLNNDHLGELICSGIIEDLIQECRANPTQGLCGRLARRVIQRCQESGNAGPCPGRLQHISQTCFHRLPPVQRANLTDIVLCVYKALVSGDRWDRSSLLPTCALLYDLKRTSTAMKVSGQMPRRCIGEEACLSTSCPLNAFPTSVL